MSSIPLPILTNGIRYLLRPVLRFAMRHGLRMQEIEECLKAELVEVAQQELESNAGKVNVSRISTLTGLRRREVQRLGIEGARLSEPRNLVARVLGLWRDHKKYKNKTTKEVKSLSFTEFEKLVREFSSDVNPAAVLSELVRVKAVQRSEDEISLVVDNYVPRGDPKAAFEILSQDSTDLTQLVEENTLTKKSPPHHHLRTEFDNVPCECLPEIERWFLNEGHDFHLKVRKMLAQYDQDVNPRKERAKDIVRIVYTSFSYSAAIKKSE